MTLEQELELVEEYLGPEDWTINELSVIFKVSQRTVYRVLAKHEAKRDRYDRPKTRKGRDARGHFTAKTKSRSKPKPPRELKPCGTEAAYRRHKRKGEYPCSPCLAAHVLDVKNRIKK